MRPSWLFSKPFFEHEKNGRLPECTADNSRLCKVNKVKTTPVHTQLPPAPFPPRSIPTVPTASAVPLSVEVRRAPGSSTSLSPHPQGPHLLSSAHALYLQHTPISMLYPLPGSLLVLASDATILSPKLDTSEPPSIPFSSFTHSKCCQFFRKISCLSPPPHHFLPVIFLE